MVFILTAFFGMWFPLLGPSKRDLRLEEVTWLRGYRGVENCSAQIDTQLIGVRLREVPTYPVEAPPY